MSEGEAAAPAAPSDESLVAATLLGDPGAFAALIGRWQRPLINTMRRMVFDAEDAEDLVQETFLRAYAALASFDPRYRFSPWLFRIATNLAINHRHRRGREVTVGRSIDDEAAFFEGQLDDDGAGHPEDAWDEAELSRRLWLAVDRLPLDYRDVLIMRHVMELSYEAIVEETGLPMGTVKSRIARARRLLAARMIEDA